MLATELYAITQRAKCSGDLECYWCAAPCNRMLRHNEPTPEFGVKRTHIAKRPANPFICVGCWLFRRKRITINYTPDGTKFKDGQCPLNHSWLITEDRALTIDFNTSLYEFLLAPKCHQMVLSLLDGEKTLPNHLQLATVNDLTEAKTDTPIHFTINGIPHQYTVYELKSAIDNRDANGAGAGTRELIRLLGMPEKIEEKLERGRPEKEEYPLKKPLPAKEKKQR